ncbi:MAG: hypothetical protein JST11_07390, partial [Acidobacteria bacterium]|nr:hypothetical protein [Acidobacteriota bacterium]
MSHRKSYNDRLGKVLSRIADESQAPPPPPSGFRIHLPLLPGKEAYVMELWQPGRRHPLRGNIPWLLSIPGPAERQTGVATGEEDESARILEWLTDRAAPPAAELPAAAHSKPEPAPPLCGRLHGAAPEISERWLDRSLAPACVSASPAGTATALAGWPAAELHRTPAPAGCALVPEAEPAAAFVGVAATAFPASGVAADLLMPASLALACASAAQHSPALHLCGFLPAPAAEPVTAFVLASSDLALAEYAPAALRLPAVPALETDHAGAAGEAPKLC